MLWKMAEQEKPVCGWYQKKNNDDVINLKGE